MLPPKIDTRDHNAWIEKMKEMVPFYTPEWRFSPEDPDPGTALFQIVSQMLDHNIERLNRVPLKNFMAFLNIFNVTLLPAKPAHAYLTFRVNEGSPQAVSVPAGTQVAAQSPDDGESLIFETEHQILLTSANITDMYNVSMKQDAIIRISDSLRDEGEKKEQAPFAVFHFPAEQNLQEHCMYISHEFVFNLKHPAVIELEIFHSRSRYKEPYLCEKLANPEWVEWTYYSGEEWVPFDQVTAMENRLILRKSAVREMMPCSVHELENRWIQCRVKKGKIDRLIGDNQAVELDRMTMKSDYDESVEGADGIAPDVLFQNDLEVNPEGFYPFSEIFMVQSAFYLGCREVLSKREAVITIDFDLKSVPHQMNVNQPQQIDWKLIMKKKELEEPEIPRVSILNVVWEYWNGKSWGRLFNDAAYETLFTKPEEAGQTIQFRCPGDLEETLVNANSNYWIRARILNVENQLTANPVYMSPWMGNIRMRFKYEDKRWYADRCITLNHLDYRDRTGELRSGYALFKPFEQLDCEWPAWYIGLDAPPLKGPISLFISLLPQKYTEAHKPKLKWQYLGKKSGDLKWRQLKAADHTDSLTRSGTLQFVGPADFARRDLLGTSAYWIRVVNVGGQFDDPEPAQPIPQVGGIYMNTVRAIQQESIRNEYPEPDKDGSGEYQLFGYPVYSEEIWVDETGYLTEEQVKSLEEDARFAVEVHRDSEGSLQKVWVRWIPVDQFYTSGENDRHYICNHSLGRFVFGDGKRGKQPPNAGNEKIKVHYKKVSGRKGNVKAGEINNLQSSIAFVSEVFNPESAGGGGDIESLEQALIRGPQVIKHRNRAVSAEDYEWLARQGSPNIAKVKCLANTDIQMKPQSGAITLVVLPAGGLEGMTIFNELKLQVEQYLLERSSNMIAFPNKIQVIEPAFLEISISAELIVRNLEQVIAAEAEAVSKLDSFLDPLHGNYDGKGWEIGNPPHPSVFYALLKSVPQVNHVDKLSMTVIKVENSHRTELSPEHAARIKHGIVVNGRHKVTVTIL